jgi:hypothetical protein
VFVYVLVAVPAAVVMVAAKVEALVAIIVAATAGTAQMDVVVCGAEVTEEPLGILDIILCQYHP